MTKSEWDDKACDKLLKMANGCEDKQHYKLSTDPKVPVLADILCKIANELHILNKQISEIK